jgi:hypothetical protein
MDTESRFSPTLEVIGAKKRAKPLFGAHGDEEIPVLISNTEVKLISGDYTATSGKLARCRIMHKTTRKGGFCYNLSNPNFSALCHG